MLENIILYIKENSEWKLSALGLYQRPMNLSTTNDWWFIKAQCHLSKWAKTFQNTPNLTIIEKVTNILGQWPQMTSDDLKTWRVINSAFEDAEFESVIRFAQNNDHDAKKR